MQDDFAEWINEIHSDYEDEEEMNDENNEDDENDINLEADSKIKHRDAVKHFPKCIKWGDQNNIDVSQKIVLRDLQEKAIEYSLKVLKKQTTINNYFKKL